MKKRYIHLLLLMILSFCSWGSLHATIRYVKQHGGGEGTSWEDASDDLQAMINASSPGDQVWVAAGTYKPTTDSDRYISFAMKNGVAIYGGFPNTGNPGMGNRNWGTHVTTLSGEDYYFYVINNNNLNSTAVLDGFTITGGIFGGMDNYHSSPTVTNCIFSGNSATFGGGMYNESASAPTVTNCIFSGNSALYGGGMFNNASSSPEVTNCRISGKSAEYGGGGMFNEGSSPTVTNSILWGNSSGIEGSSPTVTYSIVQGGYAGTGNLDMDPLFVGAGDLRLQTCSPAINTGSNAAVPSGVTTDLDGNPRVFNSGVVDMGAYEFQSNPTPVVAACQGQTVTLNGTGAATLAASALDNGSTGCGALTFTVGGQSSLSFTCANIGSQQYTLTVTDARGQMATCMATVTVQGNTPLTITCPATQTLVLGANCTAALPNYTSLAVTNDNCGVQSVTQSPAAGTPVSGTGNMTVTLTVTDVNGNPAQCSFSVTKTDNTPPTVVCRQGSVQLQGTQYTLTAADVLNIAGSSDNCGQVQVISISPVQVNCSNIGQTIQIQVTANDGNGNSASCIASLLVNKDTGLPQGWSASDIGTTAQGSSSYDFCGNEGTFTLNANGYITNTSDVQHSVYQSLCGDAELVVHVSSIFPQGGWAGIQMRETTAQGSRKFTLKIQLSTILRREIRSTTFGPTNTLQSGIPPTHTWLRLTRTGNVFTAFSSPDGVTWAFRGSATITMNSCIQVGLFVESINNTTTTQATFNNVGISGGLQPLAVSPGTQTAENHQYDQLFVQVFPNPTTGEVNIDLTTYAGRAVRLEVYSLQGRLLHFVEIPEVQTMERLDLSAYPSGMYLVKVKSEGLPDVAKRLVLNKQ